ncbi:MAG TPA: MFS transporter [Burkholderiales bacterium]|nr:MFS transporter [Burkholderiales bacterium]
MSIGFVVFLTILTHLSFAGGRVILSLTAIHLGATPFTVGVVIALLAAIPMLFAVSWGRLVDRVGVRRPMLAGVAMMLAAMLLAWAVPRLETLFAVSPLAGSGFVLFHIAVTQAAGAIGRPADRVRNFSLLALAFSTSNVLGPMLAGFAIDGIGHRHAFLALASGVLVNAAVLARCRAEIPRHEASARHGEKRRLAELLRNPDLKRVFTASAALSMAWDLFTFVTPIHGSAIGLSASAIGMILGAFGAAVFAVRLALPFLAHRVSEWRILVGACLGAGATLFAFPLAAAAPLLAALAFVLGAGLGGTQPMIMALLYARAPAGRGAEAVGVRTLLLNFSQTSVPLAFGALGSALGMLPVFWAMGAALIGAGLYAARGRQDGR